jgi:hypothetical protein
MAKPGDLVFVAKAGAIVELLVAPSGDSMRRGIRGFEPQRLFE